MSEKTLTPLDLKDDFARRLAEILADQFSEPASYFCLEHEFRDTLYLDSLDITDFVLKVENEFDLFILEEDWEKFKNVGDWLSYIKKRCSRQ